MKAYLPGASRTQWFGGRYRGARISGRILVVHTTEGGSWPGYGGGATAPHLTILPDTKRRRLLVRQHFPLDQSARALRNQAGGVQTNTQDCLQVELVGTCDPRQRHRDWLFWPDPPDWAVIQLGGILWELHQATGLPLHSDATWLPYPLSYGASPARFSFAQWRGFRGICGHQHVPENSHGDPGNIPIGRIIMAAHQSANPAQPAGNNVQQARAHLATALSELRQGITLLRAARIKGRPRPVVASCAVAFRAAYGAVAATYRRLPRS